MIYFNLNDIVVFLATLQIDVNYFHYKNISTA